MKTITLFIVNPFVDQKEETGKLKQFAAELNRLYNKFGLKINAAFYEKNLKQNQKHQYSVKSLKTELEQAADGSVMCAIIFLCKKELVAADEMQQLLKALVQVKKMEAVAYCRPDEGIQPICNDIMRRTAIIDSKTVYSKEELEQLETQAKQFLGLGIQCEKEKKFAEGMVAYREALTIYIKLAKIDEDRWLKVLAVPYHNLGSLSYRAKRYKDAEFMYTELLKIRKRLMEKEGETHDMQAAGACNSLGAIYLLTNRMEEAEKIFKEAFNYTREKADMEDDREMLQLADMYSNLANVYNRMKKMEDAQAQVENALEIQEELLKKEQLDMNLSDAVKQEAGSDVEETTRTELKKRTAANHNTLAVLIMGQKQFEQAQVHYVRALELYDALVEGNEAEIEPLIAMVNTNLANAYTGLSNPAKAQECRQKALAICEARKDSSGLCKQLYETLTKQREVLLKQQVSVAKALQAKGKELQTEEKTEEAIKCYIQAVRLFESLKDQEADKQAALLYTELGMLYWDMESLENAEKGYQEALKLYRKLAEADSKHLQDVTIACYNLGIFYQETTDEEKNQYLQEAFTLSAETRKNNEQCQEIYENLEEDYGTEAAEEGIKESLENKAAEAAQNASEQSAEGQESSETANGQKDIEAEEVEKDENAKGGFFSRLFKKK